MLRRIEPTTNKYLAITNVNLQNQLAYVWDAAGRAFFIVIIMFIFVQLWSAVYATKQTAEIAGLTLTATIWYFLLAEMIELGRKETRRCLEQIAKGPADA